MNATSTLTELSSEWRAARQLHPLYVALAREFVIETPACVDLEAGVDAPSQEGIEQSRQWFNTLDERIQVHQLRQFLQTTPLSDNESLRLLLNRHLHKQQRTAADRDKIDFLLVQYFSHATPSRLDDADCELEYVAQILEPVLGRVDLKVPDWLAPLEPIIEGANRCNRLSELFGGHLLEQGRKLKVQAGEKYFLPVAMVAFTRFSFLIRRVFFRLMHADLNAILDGLHQLEARGVTTLDCRRAHFSHQEPTDRLRMICHSWKVMFHAEYSSGQPLKMLADLRVVVEEALGREVPKGGNTPGKAARKGIASPGPAKARAAGAPAKFNVSSASAPEFELTSHNSHEDADPV
jgi:hypothetical protein